MSLREVGEQERPVLTIDVGGTKIIAALVSAQGEMIAREYFSTLADEGTAAVIDRIIAAVNRLLKLNKMTLSLINSISIAAAGIIDMDRGVITVSPNLPGWHDVPLRDVIAERCKVSVFLLNDASAAALAEHRLGAGREVNNLIFITVSTGIGGGIIVDGKLYLGASGGAGEIGHMTIDVNGPRCLCGNNGCLEVLSSGTAIAREAMARIRHGEKSSLTAMAGGNLENVTAEEVSLAAQDGDSLALAVIERSARYLGAGLVNLVHIFNPEMIVVGGGVSKMGDLLLEPVRQTVDERAFPLLAQGVRIVPARLGDDAGAFGAALFAFQQR
ncbi:MAG: ROK family protein [Dehalococcoidales bacterium]|nr:ROK family protein [Dehalococcoidales bacterium]